jgi:hypothetical protein
MPDYISHIILLPQGAEWGWYEAIRNYMLYFRVTVTQSADGAGSFHGTGHTITVVASTATSASTCASPCLARRR